MYIFSVTIIIIIKLQIELEIALFFKLEHFNTIALKNILLQCAIFSVLQYHTC